MLDFCLPPCIVPILLEGWTENPSVFPTALPVSHRSNVTSNMPVNSLPGWERNWLNVFCNLTSQ